MEQYNSIKEILDKTGTYTGLTMGSSMQPLIHQQKDNIIVVKNKGRLKKYDVPVYKMFCTRESNTQISTANKLILMPFKISLFKIKSAELFSLYL